jgi:hypothetical protein
VDYHAGAPVYHRAWGAELTPRAQLSWVIGDPDYDATGADAAPASALRAGLALAGANAHLAGRPTPEDIGNGILTAYELAALDLRGTALAVLSACQTGIGLPTAQEGVYGLRRAIALAGARTQGESVDGLESRQKGHPRVRAALGRRATTRRAQRSKNYLTYASRTPGETRKISARTQLISEDLCD